MSISVSYQGLNLLRAAVGLIFLVGLGYLAFIGFYEAILALWPWGLIIFAVGFIALIGLRYVERETDRERGPYA